MKLADKIYTALVIVMALLMLFVVMVFYFLVLPKAENPRMIQFMICFFLLLFLIFAITTTINLWQRKLSFIPTLVQAIFLLLAGWGILVAIFGFILLYRRAKQTRLEQQPSLSSIPPTGPSGETLE